MSGWKFDIMTPEYLPWKAGLYALRASCWEINLMCHLLNQFVNYREMYDMQVALEKGIDALLRFDRGVSGDGTQNNVGVPGNELAHETKGSITSELAGLRQSFLRAHPGKRMRDLYTWPVDEPVDSEVIEGFDRIQAAIQDDTARQPDPHHSDCPRFSRGCNLCLPFLDILKKNAPPVPEPIMDNHIVVLGSYTLEQLFKKPKSKITPEEFKAIEEAKTNGIFSRTANPTFLRGKHDNDLKCADGQCEPHPDTFCSIAEGGGCSALSD
jgi:hypothetical protein